jgi:hypothetical protein
MAKGRLVRPLPVCPAAEEVRPATERRAGKAPLPPEGVGDPPGVDQCDTPLETGGKVARLLIARHKSKGIKGLRKVRGAKGTLPPGKVAN